MRVINGREICCTDTTFIGAKFYYLESLARKYFKMRVIK